MSLDVASPGPQAGALAADRHRATLWVLLAGVPLVVAYYTVQMRALAGDALRGDLGIQYVLARRTAGGALPLIDFEHGWNAGAWYFSALLYRLAGGEPTLWVFLWGRATGFVLAGLAVLAIAWRLRLEPWWAAVLLPAWMLVTHVPNNKYAVPLLWLLVLLPAGAGSAPSVRAVVLRAGMVATVWWFHVELAVLLGAGTAMYDLFGARDLALRDRVLRAGAVAAGLATGALSQVAVYAVLGLGAVELFTQLLFGQAETVEANFGYPLGAPPTFRTLVYPATLLLPFVPAVWRRLSSPTRLVAFLHLAQALIAMRRTDDNHIAAGATLLAVLVVLLARDLLRSGRWRLPPLGWPERTGALLAGAAWVALALVAGFRIESRLAIVALSLACLAAVAAGRGGDRPWASIGALGAVALLVAGGLPGHVRAQVAGSEADARGSAIAAAIASDAGACLGDDRRAWVVPDPLTLYDHLDLENPTPFYLFWYTFENETERVAGMLRRGEIPAVVQVGPWPASMHAMVPQIEATLRPCAEVPVAATGDLVTIWTH